MKTPRPVTPRELQLKPCKQCGQQVTVAMQRGVPFEAYAREQFCSTVCCKQFHGVVQASDAKPGRGKKYDA